jgi:hypothetical protein
LEGHYYEKDKFYVEGFYQGYFRATEKNNCTESDGIDDCHGYFVAPPCDWSSFSEGQLYWNNVGLKQAGPIGYNGGYDALEDIWRAANVTESHVFVWWYSNSDIKQVHHNTSSAFQKVLLPEPILDCLTRRPTVEERCSEIAEVRRGDPLASCDYENSQHQRLIVSSLNDINALAIDADRSPANEMLSALKITEFDMAHILRNLLSKGVDVSGNDARAAVCEWVVANLEDLEDIKPEFYPKVLNEIHSIGVWHYVAQAIALFVGLVAIFCMTLTVKFRESKTMVFAQPTFIYLILTGFFLISGAAFTLALNPTDEVCKTTKWLEVLGVSNKAIQTLSFVLAGD